MTGWTTINITTKPLEQIEDQLDDATFPSDAIVDLLLETDAVRTVKRHHGTIVGRIHGYRDWQDDLNITESLTPFAKEAVVIQANDTSDTGEARLYEFQDAEVTQIDSYSETQARDGYQVGSKAASYIQFRHDIPCVANTTQFWKTESS